MGITAEQNQHIAHCLQVQRGNVSIPNLPALNAFLRVVEHGRKGCGLPPQLGNRHTVYIRINHWSKKGVLDRAFQHLLGRPGNS